MKQIENTAKLVKSFLKKKGYNLFTGETNYVLCPDGVRVAISSEVYNYMNKNKMI